MLALLVMDYNCNLSQINEMEHTSQLHRALHKVKEINSEKANWYHANLNRKYQSNPIPFPLQLKLKRKRRKHSEQGTTLTTSLSMPPSAARHRNVILYTKTPISSTSPTNSSNKTLIISRQPSSNNRRHHGKTPTRPAKKHIEHHHRLQHPASTSTPFDCLTKN